MALGFERRQASLIGAGDLPMARVQASVPDVSAIAGMGRDMQRQNQIDKAKADAEAEQKKGLADTLKGQALGAEQSKAFIGKDENGQSVTFMPPDGSVEFQRGYVDGFNQVQDGKFRQGMETRFNEIQSKVIAGEIQPDQAATLMQSYVEGALDTAPQHRRGAYYELGQQEIAQRTGVMVTQRAAQDAQFVADDLVAQTKQDIAEASSLAAAGGKPDAIYARIDASYDNLFRLRKISAKEAENGKLAVRQLVTGQALTSRLTTALAKGEITPDQLDRFGTAIETNDPTAEATVTRQTGRPGRMSTVEDRYKAKDVFGQITDGNLRKDISLKLRTAATDFRQYESAHADEKAFKSELDMLETDAGRFMSLSSARQDDDDKLIARVMVDDDPFNDPKAAGMLLRHLSATKYVPKTLALNLVNMANSGDPDQTEKALAIYRGITQLTNRWGDHVGDALRASMPNEAVDKLDALDKGARAGFTASEMADNYRKSRGNAEYAEGAVIGLYNTKVKGQDVDGDGFWTDFRGKWESDYGTMPDPQAKEIFKEAYRQNVIILGDPQRAFENAYERVKTRFRPSDIMLDGVTTGREDLTNPEGYEIQNKGMFGMSRPGSEYDWINNSVSNTVMDAMEAGKLVMPVLPDNLEMSPDQMVQLIGNQKAGMTPGGLFDRLVNPSQAFDSNFLGKNAKLQRIPGGDPDMPEYAIRMSDGRGHDLGPLMVERGDGSMTPLTINPHLEKARLQERFTKKKMLDGMEKGAVERLGILDGKYMGKLSLDQSVAYDGTTPFGDYLKTVAPQLTEKYNLEKQGIEDTLDRARNRYEGLTGEKVPRTKVDQLTLMQPRAAGFDVAASAAAIVDSALPDGTGGTFLLRVAAQESNFGMAAGTYRLSGDKGMTQVNTGTGLKEVQRQIARGEGRVWAAARVLNEQLGLDLTNLSKDDLDKPVVAMAVARLYIEAVGQPVPQDVEGQARWWKRHYNTVLGGGTAQQFVRSASKVPDDWRARVVKEG